MLQNLIFVAASWFPLIAVALLTIVFIVRQLWRRLPFFFLYLTVSVLGGFGRYYASKIGGHTYFYTYWVSDLIASVVAFFPMYEVFLKRMFPRFYKTGFYRNIFPAIAIVILVVAIVTALQTNDERAAFRTVSQAFDFMRTAVLVVFIGLVALMGRQWSRFDLGITLGFAIQAAVALANAAIKAHLHYRPNALDFVDLAAYDISCLIWIITFLKSDDAPSSDSHGDIDPGILKQARTWESMLKAWLIPKR